MTIRTLVTKIYLQVS